MNALELPPGLALTPPRATPGPGTGTVTLLGAGPGDPELLTIKAVKALQRARLVLYDHLVGEEVLALLPRDAERLYVGKRAACHAMPQAAICDTLVALARGGRDVLRLKGGDGYVFGRGGEEAEALAQAGIRFQVIPGITAAQGAAAAVGIPLTHRALGRSLVLATGHGREGHELDLDWAQLARPGQTVVIYMGVATLPTICQRLIQHGLATDTPAAVVERATLPGQRCLVGSLATLPTLARAAGVGSPALIFIGEGVRLHGLLAPGLLSAALSA